MSDRLKIALVGAGSRSFGPSTIRDVLLSDPLCGLDLELCLMDISDRALADTEGYAKWAAEKLGRKVTITTTKSLEKAVEGSKFVVDAIEISRDVFWAMDFHIPRKHGFKQIYGENGGPGSHFHALRNMGPIVEIADTIQRINPEALLLNFTNPMHKLCETANRLTKTQTIGLCHGVWMGLDQITKLLGKEWGDIDYAACGINHFTWFQTIKDKKTGEDLYPALREAERQADPLYDWHEIALARVLFKRFGIYPSPGANHTGEYIGWADEFYASNVHWYYDPADQAPWVTNVAPEFCYTISSVHHDRPVSKPVVERGDIERGEIKFSNELAQPIMESLACGVAHHLDAINVPNKGLIPGLPDDLVVEVPASADADGIRPTQMQALPEGIAGMIRTQASIQQLLVEAFAERSRDKLIQALLLEPMVDSYRRCIDMVDEMLTLQKDYLPELK